MGLDMYLFKRPTKKEEVAYWRKANQIRCWFVNHDIIDGDSNCTPFVVTKEDLEELISDCKAVLKNPELAEEIMPTQSGFFFGSTDYDEYYLQDLEDTIAQVSKILAETNWEEDEIIYYEWW